MSTEDNSASRIQRAQNKTDQYLADAPLREQQAAAAAAAQQAALQRAHEQDIQMQQNRIAAAKIGARMASGGLLG